MIESWLICANYLRRLARKPWLVCFLLAIPFLLLLAEFAAFGRVASPQVLRPVRLAVVRTKSAEAAQPILACLANQPGQPLVLVDADHSAMDRIEISGGVARIKFGSSVSLDDQILEASLLNLCTASNSLSSPNLQVVRHPVSVGATASVFIARFFPGLALFGALFLSQAMASAVWRDQDLAVQRRLLSMPLWRGTTMTGPILYLALGVTGSLLVVLSACLFAIQLPLVRLPVLALIALAFALFASGMQLLVGLLAKSQRAAQAVSASLSMVLAFFGGGFVPLALYPTALRTVANLLPNGAAQAALTATLLGGSAPSAVVLPIMTICIWVAAVLGGAFLLQTRKAGL